MASEKRDLLEVLTLELEFLRGGGYRKSSSWRPPFLFEDSPTCLNFHQRGPKKPCSECVLMQLVPAEFCDKQAACRYIPLNEEHETVQSLYQWGTPEELETVVIEWLMNTIQRLELERGEERSHLNAPKRETGIGEA
ncbi:MAG: hypothetical protein WA637_21910 [Terriglobales bacterium]